MEGVIHGDIDGDGDDDILCNHWSLRPGQGMNQGTLNRHILAFNHLPKLGDDLTKRNPPPNFVPSVVMKAHVKDVDADGSNDAVICGKGGLYVFYYRGRRPRDKPLHRLPPEGNYPSWQPWNTMPLPPRPAEIPRKIRDPEAAPKN
jgi:hypothetical protein